MAGFSRELRRTGIPVSPGDTIDAAAALALLDIGDPEEVRLGLRTSLKVEPASWDAFDRAFDRMWRKAETHPSRPDGARRRQPPRPWPGQGNPLEALRRKLEREGLTTRADPAVNAGRPGYSPRALLRDKEFDPSVPGDLAEMERFLAILARKMATRPSRRLVPTPGGSVIDVRRSFRRSLARGGELVELARRGRAVEKPHVVALCDTSGSMDPYSRFFIAFLLALSKVLRRTETFAFNTSLTRLTPWIASGNVADTLKRFAGHVEDWSGGTRIGACLLEFADRYLRQTVAPDTSVLIFSDGLDRGDVRSLETGLLAIRRRARRVIWLNPLMGDPRYRPEARGMKTAIPHIDGLVPAHDLASLAVLLPMLSRRSRCRQGAGGVGKAGVIRSAHEN